MFDKLQEKWKVNGPQLALILVTFATGGSLTGWVGRKLLGLTGMEHGALYYVLYIVAITLLWPLAVILVSIPFGQYPFFIKYIRRIGGRMLGKSHATVLADEKGIMDSERQASEEKGTIPASPDYNSQSDVPTPDSDGPGPGARVLKLAVFASGGGSNAQKIIDHFRNHLAYRVALIVSNKPGAGVLTIAEKQNLPSLIIDKEQFFRGDAYTAELAAAGIDFIVLAGFLWKVPSALIKAYPNKIVNIHPALLPKYGGKGMYGHFVHEAVVSAGEKESGITIHYVDEQYDHGHTIFQATCPVLPGDTGEMLAKRVLALEHAHYPAVVEECLENLK
ncbi:MAG: phosphoribosylglycinamide formyltransferase [Chitinophagaceae bacterium]